jgi:hypothetical protein
MSITLPTTLHGPASKRDGTTLGSYSIPKRSTEVQHLDINAIDQVTQNRLSTWLFEAAAAALSTLCLGAVVSLLLALDGKPYDKWRIANLHVTPNALLAIFSAACKTSLYLIVAEGTGQLKWLHFQQRPRWLLDLQVFDEASRGPLEALKLLGQSIRSRAAIASLDALVTVLAIAVDPFAQQILSFQTSMTNATHSAASITTSRTMAPQYKPGPGGDPWDTCKSIPIRRSWPNTMIWIELIDDNTLV